MDTNTTATRRRRLLLLGLILVIVVAALGGIYVIRQSQKARHLSRLRSQGIAAFKQNQYARTIDQLQEYMDNSDQPDHRAVYDLAVAYQDIKSPKQRDPGRAMKLYRKIYQSDPDYRDTGRRLMNLYLRTGRDPDMLDVADRLLKQNPKDKEALRSKAIVLARLKRTGPALEIAKRALAIDPTDLQLQVIRLRMLFDRGTPPAKLVAQAKKLRGKHPDDPRFTLLLAYAHGLNHDPKQSRRWLLDAAKADYAGKTYTKVLVGLLDARGMFEKSLDVIRRRVKADPDSLWTDSLIRRLFERGDYKELIQRVHFDQDHPPADRPSRAALLAIALYETGKPDRAKPIVAQMQTGDASVYAKTLARLLQQVYQGPNQPKKVIAAAKDVLQINANQPYARYMLGQARVRLGEREAANTAWDKVIAQRPGWATPRVHKAQLLLDWGKPRRALVAARRALTIQPNRLDAALALARARARAYDLSKPDQAKAEMATIDRILSLVKDQPEALLLKARVALASGDHATAVQAANRLVNRKPAAPNAVLVKLGDFAAEHDLKLDADPYTVASGGKATPRVTLGRARALAAHGHSDRGLALIEKGQAQAPPSDRDDWALARASYLGSIHDPRAAKAWMKLADREPKSLPVQQSALDNAGVWSHRRFVDRAIKRIHKITGDDAVSWRIHRAHYLLTGPTDQQDPQQALDLLQKVAAQTPDRVRPFVLIAQAQQMLGHPPLALNALEQAAKLDPQNPAIRLRLGRLQQQQGDYDAASASFAAVARQPGASVSEQRGAALALAQQGDTDRAIAAIAPIADQDPRARAALASLYLRSGQYDKAQAQALKLLDHKPLTPQAVDLASEVYDQRGQHAKAKAVLAKLDQADADPATRAQVLARHAMRIGDLDQAAKDLRKVVDQAPHRATGWRQLLKLNIARGDAKALADDLAQAHKAVPGDAGISRAASHAQLIQLAAKHALLHPIAQAVLEDNTQARAATDALALVQQAHKQNTPDPALAKQLTALAAKHRKFSDLAVMTAKLWLAIGRPQKAAALAKQTGQDFPALAQPPAIEARALASMKQWDAALVAAKAWRRRSAGRSRGPDLIIARAQVSLGQPDSALQTLQPYADSMTSHPDQDRAMVAVYANALARAGRVSKARRLLEPLIQDSKAWRGVWVNVAAGSVADPDTAARWLDKAEQLTPDKATDQHEALASAWWAVGTRGHRPKLIQHAAKLLDQLLKKPGASGQAWFIRAAIADQQGDLATAEADYRGALKHQPDTPVIKNNLAMVIVRRKGDLRDALTLAQQAAKGQPNNPNFLDTLATVQAKMGRFPQARKTIQKAIAMDQSNPQWDKTRQKIEQMASAAKTSG